jgi:hypothetical protein
MPHELDLPGETYLAELSPAVPYNTQAFINKRTRIARIGNQDVRSQGEVRKQGRNKTDITAKERLFSHAKSTPRSSRTDQPTGGRKIVRDLFARPASCVLDWHFILQEIQALQLLLQAHGDIQQAGRNLPRPIVRRLRNLEACTYAAVNHGSQYTLRLYGKSKKITALAKPKTEYHFKQTLSL